MRLLFIAVISIALFASCNSSSDRTVQTTANSSSHHIEIKEVLQPGGYTYLLVNEGDKEYWIATAIVDAKVGDDFYYESGLEMKAFKSKELDRTFESIYFVDKLSTVPIIAKSQAQAAPKMGGKKPNQELEDIVVEPVEGGITIAELYKNRNEYAGKKVIVRGHVVKVNDEIMKRNWVHLQDGTKDGGNFDLTLTTSEKVSVADLVTFEGIVTLNKDFGAGYSYELIIEEAVKK